MGCRLALRTLPIMACETLHSGKDFTVIKSYCRRPDQGAMTGCTIGSCLEMIRIFSRGLHTVVTRRARRTCGAMIHFCADGKSACRMADVALLNSGNMVNMFATCKLPVVATRTLRR